MIATIIDPHITIIRHMTIDTLGTARIVLMLVMLFNIVNFAAMTLQAKAIACNS